MTETDVDELAERIARRVAVIADPDALWSLSTIALHCEYKLRTVREFAARPDFPRAVRVDDGHPRYRRADVIAWFAKHQEKR